MTGITAIVLTKNEELNIARCLGSIQELADRIVVVDSGSTDKTMEIAQSMGAEIFRHPFVNYAEQFNWALDNVGVATKWVYRIDADECVPPELREEILAKTAQHMDDDVNGFLMKHKLYFLGRYLTHGGAYPFLKITVFKPEFGRFESRAMGEHIVLSSGQCHTFDNDCLHYDCKDLNTFIDKHNWYATREVADYYDRLSKLDQQADLYENAEVTKKLRDGFYYKLPLFFRAKLYYWYRYYVRMGFLDGKPGKVYAMIQAYFYRFIVDAKILESQIQKGK